MHVINNSFTDIIRCARDATGPKDFKLSNILLLVNYGPSFQKNSCGFNMTNNSLQKNSCCLDSPIQHVQFRAHDSARGSMYLVLEWMISRIF